MGEQCLNHSGIKVQTQRNEEEIALHEERIRGLEMIAQTLTQIEKDGQKRLQYIEEELASRLDGHDERIAILENTPGNKAYEFNEKVKNGFIGALISALVIYVANNLFAIF